MNSPAKTTTSTLTLKSNRRNRAAGCGGFSTNSPKARSTSYHLHKGVEREGAPRVRLRPSAFGWRASVRKEFTAELLTPTDGSPKFSFRPGGKRTSTLTMANRPAPMHRHRMGDPVVVEGPVFASLAVDYTYLDKLDRTLAVEKHYFRVFDGPVSMLLVDWSVTLVATSGPMPMDAEHGWMPTIMIDPAGDSLVAADSGWKNVDVVDRPGALVSLTVEDRTTSVMIRSDSAGSRSAGPSKASTISKRSPTSKGCASRSANRRHSIFGWRR